MTKNVLEKDIITVRMSGIEKEISELEKLGKQPLAEFQNGDGYKLAQYHLHRALEGVFNITSHILSRIPGSSVSGYRQMAVSLGEAEIVPKDFAQKNLSNMAKYRNRLVHFYAEITPKELYEIIHSNLLDFDIFLSSVKKVLENPKQFGLYVE
ncbi:hypothetical protein A3D77_03195 [Candidatus Gottesmanbacteria bacterium RIFCSPHIGHO2_02_FULL_39_11]|uniref:DUF86 domain-containing protein n=1 Tax=Candidatus Gottesmanbacteria bacterium RIFCSPHIGHO2_02_FULL_39_11 TaxID=1798382 RepID=A0A1F5ZUB9_9BACT|nr:MAG: hypothetical protein A3D77_03195 [Candidatus Gottesmanbacteria bacterium RIFCSPHIGHO2_02_FULL_39_11]